MDDSNAGMRRITSNALSNYLYSGIILEPGTYTIGLKGGNLAEGRYVFVDVLRFPTVTSPNNPPVGVDDSATVEEDSDPMPIDVLANDTDGDGDPLTIASVSNPAHGTAVVESGKVNYTPAENYNGPDEFTYEVSDGNGGTDTATVSITVNSVSDTPVAEDDEATTDEDKAVTIDVLANDTDVDGDTLTIVDGSLSNPAHGTAVVESGKVNYTPAENYNGPDEFTYEVSDGNGGTNTATVSITVNSVDDPPVAEDDSATTPEDTAVTIDVRNNDTDGGDGGTKTVESVTQPADGTVTITGGGSGLTYEPDENYCNDGSPTDDLTYKLNGGSEAKVSVTVTCVEDAPVAVNDTKTVAEDDPATTIDVLANDTDPDGGTMTIESVTQPQNGTVEITNNGNDLTYKPNADYCNDGSPTDDFTYKLNGGSEAKVSVTVTCVDDDPVAVNDNKTVAEDDPATTIDVLNNDTDVDGGSKTITEVTQPTNGTVVITNGGADLTYKPNADYCNENGQPDTFTYTLNGGSTANVAVTVTCVEDDPVAVNDSATKAEDSGSTAIDVLNNDTDVDGGSKTITEVTQPTNGTVVITNDGADLTYEPKADYCNDTQGTSPDTFTYTLSPGGSTATVSVKVTCVDDAPVAVNDSATVEEDAAATNVTVLTNDTDIDGGPKTISSASDPAKGTVVVTGGGSGLTYQPDPNYCNDPPATNLDTFTYTLNGGSQGTVSIKVTCVNDNPVATDESFNGTSRAIGNTSLVVNDPSDGAPDPNGPQKTVSGDILANDTDVDGPGPLTVQAVSNKATSDGGSVNIEADGDFTFHPKAGTSCTDHTDSFDYTLTDGNTPTAGTDTGTVTIDIQDCVWYVDSSLATNGDGRSHSPFNSLSGINGAGGAGDPDDVNQRIFLYDGTYPGGLRLENGQMLFSQRHGLVVPDGGSGNVTLEAAVPAGPNTTITGGLTLAQNNTIQGIHLGNNATGAALSGSSIGNATMNTQTSGAIDNTTGKAVDISGGTLSMQFTGVSSTNSTTDGIRLDNTAGTFSAAGGSLQSATDQDVDISGDRAGSDNVSFTYDGSITDDVGTLVNVSSQTGGTKDFNGAITDGNDGDGSGISLTNNSGATVRFDGGLTLSTGTSNAFGATGGGTVAVTDANGAGNNPDNTLATTTGTPLNVQNTTIHSDGLTFRSIAANGSANGIALNNTGAGGLSVTGTGTTAGSGGTIQNTSNRGASFISASNVSLKNMNFTNAGNTDLDADNSGLSTGDNLATNAAIHLQTVSGATFDRIAISGGSEQGINGNNVSNFVLSNSSITNPGNAADEDGIHFFNMSGTSSISDTALTHTSGGGDDNLNLQTQSGTLNLTISGGSAVGTGGGVNQLGSGYLFGIRGTTNATISFNNASSTNNFSGGIVADAFDSATMNLTVTNSTSSGNNDQLSVSAGDNSNVDLNASSNTLASVATGDFVVVSLLGSAFDTGYTFDARLQNNNISVANGLTADGITMFNAGGGLIRSVVSNNTITYAGTQRAINIQGGQDGAGSTAATITGNATNVQLDGSGNAVTGILAQVAVASPSGDNSSLCADIGGAGALANTFTHSQSVGTMPAGDIRLRQRFVSTVQLPGYGGANNNNAAVVSYLSGRNTLVNNPAATATNEVGVTAGAGGFVNTPSSAACAQPSP